MRLFLLLLCCVTVFRRDYTLSLLHLHVLYPKAVCFCERHCIVAPKVRLLWLFAGINDFPGMEDRKKRKPTDRSDSRRARKRFSRFERLCHQMNQSNPIALATQEFELLSNWLLNLFSPSLVPVLRSFSEHRPQEFRARFGVDRPQSIDFQPLAEVYLHQHRNQFINFLIRFRTPLLRDYTFLERTVMDVFIYKRVNKQIIEQVLASPYFSLSAEALNDLPPRSFSDLNNNSNSNNNNNNNNGDQNNNSAHYHESIRNSQSRLAASSFPLSFHHHSSHNNQLLASCSINSTAHQYESPHTPSPPTSPLPTTPVEVGPSTCQHCRCTFVLPGMLRRHMHVAHHELASPQPELCVHNCTILLITGALSQVVLEPFLRNMDSYIKHTGWRSLPSPVSPSIASIRCYQLDNSIISFFGM